MISKIIALSVLLGLVFVLITDVVCKIDRLITQRIDEKIDSIRHKGNK